MISRKESKSFAKVVNKRYTLVQFSLLEIVHVFQKQKFEHEMMITLGCLDLV